MKYNTIQYGEKRVKTFFAFFPVTAFRNVGLENETRWLEFVTVEQRYTGPFLKVLPGGWETVRFVSAPVKESE